MNHQNCERVQESLPWLVNGTLPINERESLLEHVGKCSQCAAWHRLERHVCAAVTAPGNNVTHPAQFGWQKLEARLDAQPAADSRPADVPATPATPTRAARGASRQRARLIWFAIAAQAAAIAVLAVALWVKLPQEAAYRTVSAQGDGLSERREYLRVALDAQSNIARGHELARDIGADLLAGPSADNIYTFVLSASRRDQVAAASQWLRRQPNVLLVESLRVEPARLAPSPAPVAQ